MSLRWAAGVGLAGVALGWQALYELGIRECRRNPDERLVLCSGPLDAWVLPLTLAVTLILIAIGIWRFGPHGSRDTPRPQPLDSAEPRAVHSRR